MNLNYRRRLKRRLPIEVNESIFIPNYTTKAEFLKIHLTHQTSCYTIIQQMNAIPSQSVINLLKSSKKLSLQIVSLVYA